MGKEELMKSDRSRYKFIKYFLIICIPLVLTLSIVLSLLFDAHDDANYAIIEANERLSAQLGEKAIEYTFGVLRGDALYLAELSSLRQWLETGDSAAYSRLTEDMITFLDSRQLYGKVRFIDKQGQEITRIHNYEGKPNHSLSKMKNIHPS